MGWTSGVAFLQPHQSGTPALFRGLSTTSGTSMGLLVWDTAGRWRPQTEQLWNDVEERYRCQRGGRSRRFRSSMSGGIDAGRPSQNG